MSDKTLVNQIQEVRASNNSAWMDLLRLALELDPVRTKAILRRIEEHDLEVNRLLRELAHS